MHKRRWICHNSHDWPTAWRMQKNEQTSEYTPFTAKADIPLEARRHDVYAFQYTHKTSHSRAARRIASAVLLLFWSILRVISYRPTANQYVGYLIRVTSVGTFQLVKDHNVHHVACAFIEYILSRLNAGCYGNALQKACSHKSIAFDNICSRTNALSLRRNGYSLRLAARLSVIL